MLVYKKDSKLKCSNCRSLSLLSNIEKVLKKLMYKGEYNFLTESRIIYELQLGFRQNFPINHTLISLTENMWQALDKGYIGCGIFVDLQKAFDAVDHKILLAKLNLYGIHGLSNKWFKSYLSNCQQFSSINGYDCDPKEINCGVPQGSVLGPLFYFCHT